MWNTQQGPHNLQRSIFITIPKKGKDKECSNYCTVVLISHVIKVMIQILKVRHQQYVNQEIPDVQTGFRTGRGTISQIAKIYWIIDKGKE